MYSFPYFSPFFSHSLLFMLSLKRLQQLFQALKGNVVLRGVLGGLGMGIIGAFLPLTLFRASQKRLN